MDTPSPTTQAQHPAATADLPQPRIPGYEILSELGRGGMGVVWKARQIPLDRTVALKMILAGPAARPETLERFRFEAEIIAHMQHPNLVTVLEVGQYQGLPYLAMEFVAGGSLERRLASRAGKADPREAAGLVERL